VETNKFARGAPARACWRRLLEVAERQFGSEAAISEPVPKVAVLTAFLGTGWMVEELSSCCEH